MAIKKTATKTTAVKETVAKATDAKETAAKAADVKETAVKEAAVKESVEVKAAEKKAPVEKKTAEKKAPVKKTALKETVMVQYMGNEVSTDDLMKKVKEYWTKQLKNKVGDMKSVTLYVKPEEGKAYFVINEDVTGYVEM